MTLVNDTLPEEMSNHLFYYYYTLNELLIFHPT